MGGPWFAIAVDTKLARTRAQWCLRLIVGIGSQAASEAIEQALPALSRAVAGAAAAARRAVIAKVEIVHVLLHTFAPDIFLRDLFTKPTFVVRGCERVKLSRRDLKRKCEPTCENKIL